MNVWIVEDESHLAQGLRMALEKRGYAVETAESLASFQRLLDAGNPEIVLLDIRLPDGDGLTAIPHILKSSDEARIIVMTAFGDSSIVVRAIKQGAYNYLDKPFPLEAAMNMIARASEAIALARRVNRMERRSSVTLAGSSPEMRRVEDFVRKVAPYRDVNILVRGESGSGKEVVARLIHQRSARAAGKLVTVNCAGLPDSLLESELFGHEKGAFTGADRRREGKFVQADGGTLFLDEIGETSAAMQVKLLRVLQEQELQRVGGEATVRVDVRILAATNRDLQEEVRRSAFREDLYYRLNVVMLTVPPLRQRGDDIRLLVNHFAGRFAEKNRRVLDGITSECMELLLAYPWPGNVRELENAIERGIILMRGTELTEKSLPLTLQNHGLRSRERDNGSGAEAPSSLFDVEKQAILKTLDETGGNKSEAARRLGITRKTLLNKLKGYDG